MPKLTSSTLAERFVAAYNLLDHSLRTQYNFKTNISFSDLVRRCAGLNQVIRVYEDDLIDLARLRNAIIHSRSEQVIAEPHEDVVEIMEKVARIISTPPLVVDALKHGEVKVIAAEASLRDYIVLSSAMGHSNIPVYKRNMLIGVMQRHSFMETLGHVMKDGRGIDNFLNTTNIEQYLITYPNTAHFTLVSSRVTIEEVIELFSNRKLSAVIITDNGTSGGKLMGIVTSADIISLMQIIEGY
jgi:predicted transcriptional regulator